MCKQNSASQSVPSSSLIRDNLLTFCSKPNTDNLNVSSVFLTEIFYFRNSSVKKLNGVFPA